MNGIQNRSVSICSSHKRTLAIENMQSGIRVNFIINIGVVNRIPFGVLKLQELLHVLSQ